MPDPQTTAEKLRAIGLFDLQPTLGGLLKAIADLLERHRISQPEDVSWRHDPSRGWSARIRLSLPDLLRVVADHPLPVRVRAHGDGASIDLEVDLRAGTLCASVPLENLEGTLTPQGLLLHPSAGATPPAHPGVGLRMR